MQTEHIQINDPALQESDLQHAAEILKQGGLVVFPTETVYGLAASAFSDR